MYNPRPNIPNLLSPDCTTFILLNAGSSSCDRVAKWMFMACQCDKNVMALFRFLKMVQCFYHSYASIWSQNAIVKTLCKL